MQIRIQLLSTAADLFGGQRNLGRAIDVGERSVRMWAAGDRGISDGVLSDTAAALDAHADRCREHAARIRAHLKEPPNG